MYAISKESCLIYQHFQSMLELMPLSIVFIFFFLAMSSMSCIPLTNSGRSYFFKSQYSFRSLLIFAATNIYDLSKEIFLFYQHQFIFGRMSQLSSCLPVLRRNLFISLINSDCSYCFESIIFVFYYKAKIPQWLVVQLNNYFLVTFPLGISLS